MEMRNRLPSVGPVVDDEPEPGIREALGLGDLPGGEEQMPEELVVRRNGLRHARDHTLGDHEDVNRCLGRNVAEREAAIILEDNVGGNLPGNDFFKKRHET